MSNRGLFIVLEGIDRAGKTTQTELLVSALERQSTRRVHGIRFPDYTTPVGQMIKEYLQSRRDLDVRAAHLLFCANRWEKAAEIEARVAAGDIVVCDRYSDSGIAYSVAKGAPFEWCVAVEDGLPRPDLIIRLVIPPEKAAVRPGFGNGDRHEVITLQEKIDANYARRGNSVCVDATREVGQVQADIWDLVLATQAASSRVDE